VYAQRITQLAWQILAPTFSMRKASSKITSSASRLNCCESMTCFSGSLCHAGGLLVPAGAATRATTPLRRAGPMQLTLDRPMPVAAVLRAPLATASE
jgi:hypothetical protein